MQSSHPLIKKLKVIDLSTVLAGPSVGSFFAELGADVVKIEHPENPDVTRSWKLPNENKKSPLGAYFSSINYKKSYRFLNFTKDKERAQLFELIKTADLVIMNFKKGAQEKLGISDYELLAKNPNLIIGKITGFGDQTDRVAYDLILQAESGMMSINGTDNSGPLKMPIALIDVLAAHHLKEGLLLALMEREMNPSFEGKTVTVSLYEAAISSLVNQASNYLMTGEVPKRMGSLHPNIAPYGELFTTKDGGLITFAIGSDKHFKLLTQWLKREDLFNDKKFASAQKRVKNRTFIFEELQQSVNRFESNEIIEGMHELGVPCAKIKSLNEVFNDEIAQNMIREEVIDGVKTKRVSGIAFKFG